MEDIRDEDAFDDGMGLEDMALSTRFWVAFQKITTRRDTDFIYELVEKLPDLFDDMSLTKQKLRDLYPAGWIVLLT